MINQPRHINMRRVEEEAAFVSAINVILCKSEFELI
jgi:hypothetical protein